MTKTEEFVTWLQKHDACSGGGGGEDGVGGVVGGGGVGGGCHHGDRLHLSSVGRGMNEIFVI